MPDPQRRSHNWQDSQSAPVKSRVPDAILQMQRVRLTAP